MKYWFMNLSYRWTGDFEKMDCVKIIYDMQDSHMFIFCKDSYYDWFCFEYMENTIKFTED